MSYAERIFLGRLRQQDDEFIAAVAERQIDQAAFFLDGFADFRQQLRTDQVAVGIVHGS